MTNSEEIDNFLEMYNLPTEPGEKKKKQINSNRILFVMKLCL